MISYSVKDEVATLQFDDGKANVFSIESAAAFQEALNKAEQDDSAKVVVLRGRKGQFSAGFNLKVFQSGDVDAMRAQAVAGFEVLCRMVAFPKPFVTVSEGHAIGMGAFVLLAADNRISSDAPCKIGLPETAISMPLEPALLKLIAKDRLAPAHYITAALQSKMHLPEEARDAGFLDVVVPEAGLDEAVNATVEQLKLLPSAQYGINKRMLKGDLIAAITANLELAQSEPEKLFG